MAQNIRNTAHNPYVSLDLARDIDFLRKGDKIIFVERTAIHTPRLATVDMNGHGVSTEYGFAVYPEKYNPNLRRYINVKWDDFDYGTARTYSNTSIYSDERRQVFALPEVADRIKRERVEWESTPGAQAILVLRRAQQAVIDARIALDEAEKELANVQRNQKG